MKPDGLTRPIGVVGIAGVIGIAGIAGITRPVGIAVVVVSIIVTVGVSFSNQHIFRVAVPDLRQTENRKQQYDRHREKNRYLRERCEPVSSLGWSSSDLVRKVVIIREVAAKSVKTVPPVLDATDGW